MNDDEAYQEYLDSVPEGALKLTFTAWKDMREIQRDDPDFHCVLDDGYVRITGTFGEDETIVETARVSYGEGTTKLRNEEGLIRHLMRHHHTGPFESCEIRMLVRCPIDVARQWMRHRTWSYNEYSTRYSVALDSAQKTEPDKWRLQGTRNKQGSEGYLDTERGRILSFQEQKSQEMMRGTYNERLEVGVAREQARKDLPMSTYTEFYAKVDLHNLFHFLALRMDSHAQEEIRLYAEAIAESVKRWVPLAWAAFEDYRLNALTLSSRDLQIINASQLRPAYERQGSIRVLMEEWGWAKNGRLNQKSGELHECIEKLHRLGMGMPLPWHVVFPE